MFDWFLNTPLSLLKRWLKVDKTSLKNLAVWRFLKYVWPFFNIVHEKLMLNHSNRGSHQKCSVKKGVLKNFSIFTEKHLCWSLFLIKLQVFRAAALLKRDSNTGFFLWILPNFQKHLFWRTPVNGCLYQRKTCRKNKAINYTNCKEILEQSLINKKIQVMSTKSQ